MKLLVLLLMLAAHPVLAAVGVATLELENRVAARRIAVEMWYTPAGNPKVEDLTIRPPLRSLPLARDAAPATGKRPLVVLSHGNWGTRYSQGWLAMKLADAGYVVLSTTHPGTVGDDQSAAGRYRLWDRARDVSFALDQVLKDPKWAALVDESRIGFVGHSFGGWTGVSLAGARYDAARQREFCKASVKKDPYCDGTLKDDIAGIPAADAGESFKDARLKAFYIMASGPGQGFSADSLKSISAPFVVDTAQFDEILHPQANSSALAKQIPGAREIVRPVGHFAYVPECRPVIGKVLTAIAGIPICDDAPGVDRRAVHEQVAGDVVRFFRKALAIQP